MRERGARPAGCARRRLDAVVRLVLVLAAVLGVVAMHGLTTGNGHHGTSAVAEAGPEAVVASGGHAGHGVTMTTGVPRTAEGHAADDAGAGDGAAGGAVDALLHLCLAVVTVGAALAAVVARRSRRRVLRAGRSAWSALRVPVVPLLTTPPWTHPSRAELCLWRV